MNPEYGKQGHLRRLLWTQFQLPKIYRKLQSHLLFSPIPEAPVWSGCRFVVMMHDLIPLRFPKLTSPLTHYFRYGVPQVLTQAEHILCNSMATAEDVMNFFQIPAKKITPIPLAHNAQQFRPLDGNEISDGDRPYFLYVGRHDPYKNLHRLICAFANLPHPQAHELRLAGAYDSRYTPILEAQVRELGLTNAVKFLDYVPEQQLPVLMGRAIALVFPSLWEGFGFPVLEAMACGTPVITSNLSSLPEVAKDAAILVNPYSVAEITDAMQQVGNDEGLRSHLRSAGLARASQFSWQKTAAMASEVLWDYL
jgi:glycosyltransferase involved in cell wall biosynthesis